MFSISANSITGRYQHRINEFNHLRQLRPEGQKAIELWFISLISSVAITILGALDLAICFVAAPITCSKVPLRNLLPAIVIVVLAPFRIIANLFGVYSQPSLDYFRSYIDNVGPRPYMNLINRGQARNSNLVNEKVWNNRATLNPLEQVIFELWTKPDGLGQFYAITRSSSPHKLLQNLMFANLKFSADESISKMLFKAIQYSLNTVSNINEVSEGGLLESQKDCTLLDIACEFGLVDVMRELVNREALIRKKTYESVKEVNTLKLLLEKDKSNLEIKFQMLVNFLDNHNYDYDISRETKDLMADLLSASGTQVPLDIALMAVMSGLYRTSRAAPLFFEHYLAYGSNLNEARARSEVIYEINKGNWSRVKRLLAYVGQPDKDFGLELFNAAAKAGQISILETLHDRLEKINEDPAKLALCQGSMGGHLPIVKKYLPKVLEKAVQEEALCNAALGGHYHVVEELLKNGVAPNVTFSNADDSCFSGLTYNIFYSKNEVASMTNYSREDFRELLNESFRHKKDLEFNYGEAGDFKEFFDKSLTQSSPVVPSFQEFLDWQTSRPLYNALFIERFQKKDSSKVVEKLLRHGAIIPYIPFVVSIRNFPQERFCFDYTNRLNVCVTTLKKMVIPIFAELETELPPGNFIIRDLFQTVFDYLAFPFPVLAAPIVVVDDQEDEIKKAEEFWKDL